MVSQAYRDHLLTLEEQVGESNRIESISRPPTQAEIDEHKRFRVLGAVTIEDLKQFLAIYQPNARLRIRSKMNVLIVGHRPPNGGPQIRRALQVLLDLCKARKLVPWDAHAQYEMLHPWTDGNGQSGRMLWYWMQERSASFHMADYGFLRGFYYQTLRRQQAIEDRFHPDIAKALGRGPGGHNEPP
jgi:hypothetical protein